jgi:hypothetical protein
VAKSKPEKDPTFGIFNMANDLSVDGVHYVSYQDAYRELERLRAKAPTIPLSVDTWGG